MKSILIIIALLPAAASIAFSQTAGRTEQKLLQLNRAYDDALVRGDAVALDRIYGDEFIYVSPGGDVRDKPTQLAFTRSGDLRLESGRSDDVKIRIYGNTAVMTGRFFAKGKFKGKEIDIREIYTAVWVKRRGRWLLVAEQGNLIRQQ